MTSKHDEFLPAEESTNISKDLNEGRREALRRLGKFGAYTAPALLAMLTSDKAAAATLIPE
jgi:hypothetical protein